MMNEIWLCYEHHQVMPKCKVCFPPKEPAVKPDESSFKLKFEAEDFGHPDNVVYAKNAAKWANDKFQAWLSEQPVVVQAKPKSNFGWYEERPHLHDKYQRKARLVAIEPLKPAKCEHRLDPGPYAFGEMKCENCGVKLKATWEAVND